jgi:type IV pilus assembly protein PilV
MNRLHPSSFARHQRGSFMLEALIGILIFSFGVLGLIGLQAQSIRHMNDAQYRGEAVYLTNALVAKMWADDPATLAAKYATGGPEYLKFQEMVNSLPGATLSGNAPQVVVAPGPSLRSSMVSVTVFWQGPSDTTATRHNYTTMAVVGLNE